jgi:two-component system response regulator YesN
MPFKVVFVEDEIVTREGIRDNVDWFDHGFEFCGEAPDGEMALQLLLATKPDLLITDIKMPFMDGLQLCKVVRERMPELAIVILSGHDEFEYAQEAIKIGVTEYLLKPVTVQDIHQVLDKIARRLEQDKVEREKIHKLHVQIEESQAHLRERLLLKLIIGAVPSPEAIENCQSLGLDLIAKYYLIVILKIELSDRSEQFNFDEYQHVQHIIASLVENNPDVFLIKKDWEEVVLIMKGNNADYLVEERDFLLDVIKRNIKKTRYRLIIGTGSPKNRIAYIYQSFVEALVEIHNSTPESRSEGNITDYKADLLKVDKSAVENFLRYGVKEDFDTFFGHFTRPLNETALKSYLIKNYLTVDVVIATVKFINELGGNIDHAVAEFNSIESILANMRTIQQFKEQVRKILISAIEFRDSLTKNQYMNVIQHAKNFIDQHYMDASLSLNEVAVHVNLSPSHFSAVFSQETSQTFKEYLTEIRIRKAKEYLRMTPLRSIEISYRVGYNDPHYFSFVFRKNTGLSPSEFRSQAQVN